MFFLNAFQENLLIEFRLLLLSPDTEALSILDDAIELLATMLCVRERRFSFSASDLKGRFGVSWKNLHSLINNINLIILIKSISLLR